MKLIVLICCLITLGSVSTVCVAQQGIDTSDFYFKLYQKANKHAWSRWLYKSSIKSFQQRQLLGDTPYNKKNTNKQPFSRYKGKIIQHINIMVLDPFGNSVNSFVGTKPNYSERLGNKFHITSKQSIVRNLLLFSENNHVDPLKVSESERLLRLSPALFDARIYIFSSKLNDSVDIMVVVQDKWSLVTWSQFDPTQPDIKLSENNLLGFGHHIEEQIKWDPLQGKFESNGKYAFYNFRKTFIQGSLFYTKGGDEEFVGASLLRPFYSPIASWAGGAGMVRYNANYLFLDNNLTLGEIYSISHIQSEFWAARSFSVKQIRPTSFDPRTRKFIVGAGIFSNNFDQNAKILALSNTNFRSEKLYLSSFGMSIRTYYRDRYLFRYGANEDIPEGLSVELIEGVLEKQFQSNAFYSAVKFSIGKHTDNYGYLALSIGLGSFFNKSQAQSGVLNVETFFFSNLIPLNTWYLRQFIRSNYIQGINRTIDESIGLSSQQMYGFSNDMLHNNSKLTLNFETVMYTPYKWLGFQFAPVLFIGFTELGTDLSMLVKSPLYQAYALGILIRNEYLVSSTFQLSIGLYPIMPGNPDFLIKSNPISTYAVKARDYFISRPEKVAYQ